MNKLLNTKNLPWAILAAGLMGGALRFVLFAAGTDGAGLLTSGHAAELLLWLLTACTGALLVLGTRNLLQAPKYSFNFPASLVGAVGTALAAAGVLFTSITTFLCAGDALNYIDAILATLSAGTLLFLANSRWKGMHPSVLFHTVLCAYLMIHLVSLYRQWSGEPQIQDYCFSLLASVSLLLACYYDAAFAANSGNRKLHTLFHLAAVYFCLLSLPKCHNPVFYLTMAVWMFTNLCNLTPLVRTEPEAR